MILKKNENKGEKINSEKVETEEGERTDRQNKKQEDKDNKRKCTMGLGDVRPDLSNSESHLLGDGGARWTGQKV